MKPMHSLAAGLLLLTGLLHLASVAFVTFEPTSIITLIFGAAYLVIGFFLFRSGRTVLWFGAVVPLVGLLLAAVGILMNPTLLGALFIGIDLVVIVCCLLLIFSKARKVSPV
jgi:hypothetical protein